MNAPDLWSALALATSMSEKYGGEFEVGYSNGKYTVERAPLSNDALCPDYRKWRDALYLEFGVQ